MILFLRDDKNRSLCDVEYFVKSGEEGGKDYLEIKASVCIGPYTDYLLSHLSYAKPIRDVFEEIEELRGWLWERYFMGGPNRPEAYEDVLTKLREMFLGYASILPGVAYIED